MQNEDAKKIKMKLVELVSRITGNNVKNSRINSNRRVDSSLIHTMGMVVPPPPDCYLNSDIWHFHLVRIIMSSSYSCLRLNKFMYL